MNTRRAITLLAFTCLFATQAAAQATPFTLAERQFGETAYVSGGIGDEERDEIRQRKKDFNLQLLFAERDGSYLADVAVRLQDARGRTVLDTGAAGPFLLVRLPAGNYLLKATANGQEQQAKLSVPAKGQRQAIFRW